VVCHTLHPGLLLEDVLEVVHVFELLVDQDRLELLVFQTLHEPLDVLSAPYPRRPILDARLDSGLVQPVQEFQRSFTCLLLHREVSFRLRRPGLQVLATELL